MINQNDSLSTTCNVIYIYIYGKYYVVTQIPLNSEKRVFDHEGDLVGVSYAWYLLGQSFITRLKLVLRELDWMSMNG